MNHHDYINHIRTLDPNISYQSNQEYRQCIRRIFRFNPNIQTFYADLPISSSLQREEREEGIDPESKDEMDLDMDALEEGMNIIFLATCDDPIFHTLYEYAAGRMFSTDPKIGQAVLCSYDTFAWYFSCVWHYLVDSKEKPVVELQEYRQLCSWFSIRSDSI